MSVEVPDARAYRWARPRPKGASVGLLFELAAFFTGEVLLYVFTFGRRKPMSSYTSAYSSPLRRTRPSSMSLMSPERSDLSASA